MSFTSKVSNIIKTKIASNLMGQFQNSFKGAMGQPKKLAAKLANKSPLDLSKSPVAHMEARQPRRLVLQTNGAVPEVLRTGCTVHQP